MYLFLGISSHLSIDYLIKAEMDNYSVCILNFCPGIIVQVIIPIHGHEKKVDFLD